MINGKASPHIVQILNPDFNISFNSSLNLSYVCIFELQKRDLLYRWRSIPSYTLNKIAYAFATTLRQKDLTYLAEKLSALPSRPELTPTLNLLTVWEQHSFDDSQIAEALRTYILSIVRSEPLLRARPATPRLSIKIYDTFHPSKASGWRKKKNIYAVRLDKSVDIIKRMARQRKITTRLAKYFTNNIMMWADLSTSQLNILADGLTKLSNHPKMEDEEGKVIESLALIISTGEINRMNELSKKDYSLDDTFLGNIVSEKDSIDKKAQLAGKARLEAMRDKMKKEGRI